MTVYRKCVLTPGPRGYRGKGDLSVEKRIFNPAKKGIDGLDQARIGPPVHPQGKGTVSGIGDGGQIGKDIRAPKGIDGLFGVPDEKKRGPRALVDPVEDAVLGQVSVLEFIDEGRRVAIPDFTGQPFCPGSLQGTSRLWIRSSKNRRRWSIFRVYSAARA